MWQFGAIEGIIKKNGSKGLKGDKKGNSWSVKCEPWKGKRGDKDKRRPLITPYYPLFPLITPFEFFRWWKLVEEMGM